MWLRGIRNVLATFYLRTQTHSCELRFFKILLIVHSRIRHACLCGQLPTKTSFSNGTSAVATLADTVTILAR